MTNASPSSNPANPHPKPTGRPPYPPPMANPLFHRYNPTNGPLPKFDRRLQLKVRSQPGGMMRSIVLIGLLLSCPFKFATACRGPFPPFEKNLADASVVFVGRVAAVTQVVPEKSEKTPEFVEITFTVERMWKGDVGETVRILSETHSCGFARGGFRGIGEKWLILASGEPRPSTSLLSGNVWLEFEDRRSTGNKIPKSLEAELGKGIAPAKDAKRPNKAPR